MSVTKWILMDWLGTATNVRETVVPELERFGKRCRINANWDEVMEAWGLAHRAILDQVVAGQLTWRPQSQVFLEAFRDVLTKVGIDFEAIPNIALEELSRFLINLKPWPDSKDGIAMLRQVRPTALFSLSSLQMVDLQIAEADIPFDRLISAEPYRSMPPDPDGFAGAASELGIDPKEAVFLSSHPPMLRGAVNAGMKAVQIERPIRESRVVIFQPTRDLNLLGRFPDIPKAAEWLAANLR